MPDSALEVLVQPIQGIHHITALARDPQINVGFYHDVLGQRLVKTTINFDDPGTYHLYYGDQVGTLGTILTFFPWRMAVRGRRGNGEVAATAYAIRTASVDYWRQRLDSAGVALQDDETRFGRQVIRFADPEGTSLELVVTDEPATISHWGAGPVAEAHALRGFYSATLWLDGVEATAEILARLMGYRFVDREENRYRYAAAGGDIGAYIDLLDRPGEERARFGAGSIHHIAYRTVDDAEQLEYQSTLRAGGLHVTPVQDRQYFRSIYYREPGGVLFEVATDAPGFAYDEPVPELGTHLKLPDWYEPRRADIERSLPRFTHPGTGRVLPQPSDSEDEEEGR